MMTTNHYFEEVTLLITHYNRSRSLERLLRTFRQLNCIFANTVVSDDGSSAEHQIVLKKLQKQYDFQLITTLQNQGLGNNINKGQKVVNTAYTLYIQEDFVPKHEFVPHFIDALSYMSQDKQLDIVRFYAYFSYPYLKLYAGGFSEMIFKSMPWYVNHLKFYYYSDHPHLRRSNFLEKFGLYIEGENVDITEFNMCLSFLKKNGRGLFFDRFTTLFDQVNSQNEPSTALYRKNIILNEKIYLFLRRFYLIYRLFKNTLELSTFDVKKKLINT